MGKLVKCIDNFGVEKVLSMHQVYEVTAESGVDPSGKMTYYKLNIPHPYTANSFSAARFVDVSEAGIVSDPPTQRSNSYTALPAVLQPSKAGKQPIVDAAEEHCRNVLTNTLEPGHCPCKILRHMCDYHKE